MAYKRILVPLDGSTTAQAGLKEALKMAASGKGAVRLLHVVDDTLVFRLADTGIDPESMLDELRSYGRQILQKAEKTASGRAVKVETDLSESLGLSVADAIVRAARRWRADLIVIGTHGRRGMNRLLMGSDAELVLRHASVPVLLVRGATPVRATRPRVRKR